LISQFGQSSDALVDSARLSAKVRIKRAEYDSGMALRAAVVELQKVTTVVRQQNPAFGGCESQHFGVRYGRVRLSSFPRSQDIMAQATQLRYNLQRHVFIGIKARH
jgi:hypothetical protein